MTTRPFTLLLAGLLLAGAGLSRADIIRLVNGDVYEGRVMSQNAKNVVFESGSRYMTFSRGEIESLEQSGEVVAVKGRPSVQPVSSLFTTSVHVEQGPLSNLVVRVGQGGVTMDEYRAAAVRHARSLAKSPAELSVEEKQAALGAAIDDEILFQAALAAGVHSGAGVRALVNARYRAMHTAERVTPESIPDEEVAAQFREHAGEFLDPAMVKVRMRVFTAGATRREVSTAWETAQRDPAAVSDWKDVGWIAAGSTPDMLTPPDVEYLFTLQTGTVSKLMSDTYGTSFFFWMLDRKGAAPKTYEAAAPEIRKRLMAERVRQLEDEFEAEAIRNRGKMDTEQYIFGKALSAGVHRDWAVRQLITETYVQAKRKDRKELARDLRRQYEVTSVGP